MLPSFNTKSNAHRIMHILFDDAWFCENKMNFVFFFNSLRNGSREIFLKISQFSPGSLDSWMVPFTETAKAVSPCQIFSLFYKPGKRIIF